MMWKLWLATLVLAVTIGGISGYFPELRSSLGFSSPDGGREVRRSGPYIDIVLILDDSSSIAPNVFHNTLAYLVKFNGCRTYFETRVGVIVSNCAPRTEVPLGRFTMGDEKLTTALGSIQRQGGLSRPGPTIRYMMDTSRFYDGVHPVAVVLTDGFIQGEDDHTANAAAARAAGITMYSVGVGDRVDMGALNDIAGDASRVFDDSDPCDLYRKITADFGKDFQIHGGDDSGSISRGDVRARSESESPHNWYRRHRWEMSGLQWQQGRIQWPKPGSRQKLPKRRGQQ
ncbi:PREDICTED: matrilin-4-like [Branchiostoma belcheri]|uniref:Matrilin-4-like n=1 Tax=Branchiostoma belcheri TaxID=7741 RepID=A0A6P4ZZY6_BRABE|nr:PREDICTED: matrilin-4-like [Branchiostoma belcheri]